MTQDFNKVTNLHESMRNAAFASVPNDTTVVSVRMSHAIKDAVGEICERNGTTLGAFLRQCCEDVLKDYIGITDN